VPTRGCFATAWLSLKADWYVCKKQPACFLCSPNELHIMRGGSWRSGGEAAVCRGAAHACWTIDGEAARLTVECAYPRDLIQVRLLLACNERWSEPNSSTSAGLDRPQRVQPTKKSRKLVNTVVVHACYRKQQRSKAPWFLHPDLELRHAGPTRRACLYVPSFQALHLTRHVARGCSPPLAARYPPLPIPLLLREPLPLITSSTT
jgi:hypothetical protein